MRGAGTRTIWSCSVSLSQIERDYILLYQVILDENVLNIASRIANEKGKKLICIILNKMCWRTINGHRLVIPTIEEWISYVRYADAVITDSYHACIFSVLFNVY